ncbi:MAG: chalcone isomerase family protein [Burkholderiales bacterium]
MRFPTFGLARPLLAALLLGLFGSAMAAVVEVSGVKYEDSVTIRGTPVILNGAGVRYRAIFKVYTAGLYLNKKAETSEAVMASTGPKRLTIQMLREIDTNDLGKLFTRGVEDNTPRNEMSKLIPGLIRMSQIFSDHKKLLPGDSFTLEYVPGVGTIITVKGQTQGEPFKEPAFFNAMMSIWLGNKPADANLKEALLGKPTNY